MPEFSNLLALGFGTLAHRSFGRMCQVLFVVVVWIKPESARLLVWLIGLRYPRAKDALVSQLDELLQEPSRLHRRADVLDGMAGAVTQARDIDRAERDPRTATQTHVGHPGIAEKPQVGPFVVAVTSNFLRLAALESEIAGLPDGQQPSAGLLFERDVAHELILFENPEVAAERLDSLVQMMSIRRIDR